MSFIFWSVSADSSSLSRDFPPVDLRIRVLGGLGDLEDPGLTRLTGDSFSSVESLMGGDGCDVETDRSSRCRVGDAKVDWADETAVTGVMLTGDGAMLSLAAIWDTASAFAALPRPRPAAAAPRRERSLSDSAALCWCSSLAWSSG